MKCVQCGRERKMNMARTDKFCTQRCIINWLEANPDKNWDDAMGEATPTVPISNASIQNSATPQQAGADVATKKKPVSRALKNLQIDMALPGTKLSLAEEEEERKRGSSSGGSSSDEGKTKKKAKLAPPVSTVTTRATRRSLASLTASKPSKTTPTATRSATRSTQLAEKTQTTPVSGSEGGAKRALSASAPHPPALKKVKTSAQAKESPKAVTFNLEFVADNPSSTPTFSLVPIDQFAGSLTDSLLDQHNPIPTGKLYCYVLHDIKSTCRMLYLKLCAPVFPLD